MNRFCLLMELHWEGSARSLQSSLVFGMSIFESCSFSGLDVRAIVEEESHLILDQLMVQPSI